MSRSEPLCANSFEAVEFRAKRDAQMLSRDWRATRPGYFIYQVQVQAGDGDGDCLCVCVSVVSVISDDGDGVLRKMNRKLKVNK